MSDLLQQEGVVYRGQRELSWSLRFRDDLERVYTDELKARQYHPKPGTSISELGRMFHQLVRARLEHLEKKKLRVRYAREMKTQPRRAAIAEIAKRARRGDPLWPYLSKETRKPGFNDDLLSHWGIVHFHLGDGFDKNGYVTRGGENLYAWVAESKIYFLGVRNHAFADDRLLNVVVRNWPELLAPFKLRSIGGTASPEPPELVSGDRMRRFTRTTLVHRAPKLSPGQTTTLRGAGVTPTFFAETGVQYAAPGGGVSCAGLGIHAQVRADHEFLWAKSIASVVVAELDQLIEHIERERGPDSRSLEFHIEDLDALRSATVVERVTRVRFHLPMKFDYELDPAKLVTPLAAAALR